MRQIWRIDRFNQDISPDMAKWNMWNPATTSQLLKRL